MHMQTRQALDNDIERSRQSALLREPMGVPEDLASEQGTLRWGARTIFA